MFNIDRFGVVGVAHIGNDGEAEGAETAVGCDNRLWDRAHADDIGPNAAQKAVLGPRFEVRPGDGDRDTAVADEVRLAGDFCGCGNRLECCDRQRA